MNVKMDFKPGDVIEYCGEEYLVLENQGTRGRVQENYEDGDIIYPFYWSFDGRECKLVKSV